jgi:uncharacterized membrane protein YidH (DUF202 family)
MGMDATPPSHDNKKPLTNEHLSNERTLLAWIRTAVGIMALALWWLNSPFLSNK